MLKGENLAGIDKYVHRPEAKDQDHKIDTTAEANDVGNGAVQGWGQSLGIWEERQSQNRSDGKIISDHAYISSFLGQIGCDYEEQIQDICGVST